MDVPLATDDIRIHKGLKGYRNNSSTVCPAADVDGFSAFIETFWGKNFKIMVTEKEIS